MAVVVRAPRTHDTCVDTIIGSMLDADSLGVLAGRCVHVRASVRCVRDARLHMLQPRLGKQPLGAPPAETRPGGTA